MIIHLGMNPERGGRPPSDSMIARISEVISGVYFIYEIEIVWL